MPNSAKILIFAGSARVDSFNKKLASLAAAEATRLGGDVTLLDLKDYPLPLFDQDVETAKGLPINAVRLKEAFKGHDGFLIACPEYNSSITPLWKNVIDWCSRAADNEPPLVCYRNKIVALVSASPGALGGLRALTHYRQILSNIGAVVLPDQLTVSAAHEAFSEDGDLKDPALIKRLSTVVESLIRWTGRAENNR